MSILQIRIWHTVALIVMVIGVNLVASGTAPAPGSLLTFAGFMAAGMLCHAAATRGAR